MRGLCTALVLAIAWLYLVPQLHGAGLVLREVTGLPRWVGVTAVALVVTLNVVAGGMRSITLVQALQYWFKLVAIALPVLVVLARQPARGDDDVLRGLGGRRPGLGGAHPAAEIYSLMLATFLGTMGLPHVLVRFYTNVDGGSARATTVRVLALLGVFYVFPDDGRGARAPVLPPPAARPGRLVAAARCRPQVSAAYSAALLGALVAAGAIAAFLATSSGSGGRRGRGAVHRCAARPGAGLPGGRRGGRAGAVGHGAADDQPGHLPGGRHGFRGGGVDVLPAAGAGHLVARADHRRCGRRVDRGWGLSLGALTFSVMRRGCCPARSIRCSASPLSVCAGGVRHDDRGLAVHPVAGDPAGGCGAGHPASADRGAAARAGRSWHRVLWAVLRRSRGALALRGRASLRCR